jgi:hypothetical protein
MECLSLLELYKGSFTEDPEGYIKGGPGDGHLSP